MVPRDRDFETALAVPITVPRAATAIDVLLHPERLGWVAGYGFGSRKRDVIMGIKGYQPNFIPLPQEFKIASLMKCDVSFFSQRFVPQLG